MSKCSEIEARLQAARNMADQARALTGPAYVRGLVAENKNKTKKET